MDWIIVAITVILLVAYIFLRRKNQISAETAIAYMKHGAILIDVRSAAEYDIGHLEGARNMPLPEIDSLVAQQVQDRNQVLLLHCQSGARSGMAKSRLIALGYTNAHNLGSYDRAAHILGRSSS
jgi:phage shock protein E